MSNNTTIPSLEEFTALVAKALAPCIEAVRQAINGISAEEYVATEKIRQLIAERYEQYCREFEAGKITARCGCVDSVANCLDWMYDDLASEYEREDEIIKGETI